MSKKIKLPKPHWATVMINDVPTKVWITYPEEKTITMTQFSMAPEVLKNCKVSVVIVEDKKK